MRRRNPIFCSLFFHLFYVFALEMVVMHSPIWMWTRAQNSFLFALVSCQTIKWIHYETIVFSILNEEQFTVWERERKKNIICICRIHLPSSIKQLCYFYFGWNRSLVSAFHTPPLFIRDKAIKTQMEFIE